MNDLELKTYKLIDEELSHLSQNPETAIKFDIYSTIGQAALKIIQDYNLISFRQSPSPVSIADITINGEKVRKAEGIKNYLELLNNKAIQKENLEYEKLESELALLKKQLIDYPLNKRRSRKAFIISIIAICISLGLLILEVIKFLT